MDWHDSSCLLVQLCVASTSFIIYRERSPRRVDTIRAAFLSPPPKEESAAFFAPSIAYRTRSASAPSSRCSNEPSIEDLLQIINETIRGGLEVCTTTTFRRSCAWLATKSACANQSKGKQWRTRLSALSLSLSCCLISSVPCKRASSSIQEVQLIIKRGDVEAKIQFRILDMLWRRCRELEEVQED